MTLKKFLKIIWQNKGMILGITILLVVAVLFFGLFQPPKYEAYLDVEVKRMNQPETQDYQYDEYYALQANDFVTNTIQSWFENKNFTQKLLTEVGFDQNNLPRARHFLKSRKLSSQNLEIKITSESKKTTIGLAKAVQEEIETKVENLNLNQEGEPTFKAAVLSGPVRQVWFNLTYGVLAGLVGGILLGIFLSLLFYYFKGEK